jgi:hypothetical protein
MQKMLDNAIRCEHNSYMTTKQGNSKMKATYYVYNPMTREWKCVNNMLAVVVLQKVSGYTLLAKGK